jgi:hypothetical protein
MEMKDLTKKVPSSSTDEQRAELGHLASTLLGYGVLARQAPRPGRGLVELLIFLKIEVFDNEEVEKYMDERMALAKSGQEIIDKKTAHDDEEDDSEVDVQALKWQRTDLRFYRKQIPEETLALAIQIKQAEPQACFYVHTISDKDPDPFLSVCYDDQEESFYYISVWDEPKFTGKISPLTIERANLRNK